MSKIVPAKCKFCGELGLVWRRNADSTWRLLDPETDITHSCPAAIRYYENERRLEEESKIIAQRFRDNRKGYL